MSRKRNYHVRLTAYEEVAASTNEEAIRMSMDRFAADVLSNLDDLDDIMVIEVEDSEPLDEEDEEEIAYPPEPDTFADDSGAL